MTGTLMIGYLLFGLLILASTYIASPQDNLSTRRTAGELGCELVLCVLLVALWPLILIAFPVASQTITQPPGTTFSANSLAGVQEADAQLGSDIGEKINAATAACSTASCYIETEPGHVYPWTNQIVVPATNWTLDCHNSTLQWSSSSTAVTVTSKNDDSPTGGFKNCIFSSTNPSANGILQHSRIWFTYENDEFYGWSTALEFLNDPGTGWPGYNERTHVLHSSFSNNAVGMYFHLNGGTNSYARNYIDAYFDLQANQVGVLADNGAYIYGGSWHIHSNANSGGNAVVKLNNYSVLAPSFGDFEGEGTGCGLLTDSTTDILLATDDNMPGPCLGGPSDQELISPHPQFATFQSFEFNHGVQQANNNKVIWDGESWRTGLTQLGGYPGGLWQIFWRNTNVNPEVDNVSEVATAPQTNLEACFAPQTTGITTTGGCGFGPGFGVAANTGGTYTPIAAIDTFGGFANRDPSHVGVNGGATFTQTWYNGTLTDAFQGGSLPGQNGYTHQETFYDNTTYNTDTGMTRYAHGGIVHYAFPSFTLGGGAEATSAYSGTISITSTSTCTLTVSSGLITAKSGGC
jgi:hypothetical protein